MMPKNEWIVETSDQTFEADVIAKSRLGLVVLDFWADWCAPCKILAPILEKLANEYAGEFTLVKANTDATQEAASQFGVSGIPTVYAVLDGEVVDAFQGLMPENSVKEWLDKSLNLASLSKAQKLMGTDPVAAEASLRAIVEKSPTESAAWVALAELLLQSDRTDECLEIIRRLEQRGFLEPRAERVKAAVEIKKKGEADIDAARASAAANPNDFSLQLALADVLAGKEEFVEACEICLSLIARDRKHSGEKARELMIAIFRALPDDSELTQEYRRKLSTALY